jgi:hypothetical protein
MDESRGKCLTLLQHFIEGGSGSHDGGAGGRLIWGVGVGVDGSLLGLGVDSLLLATSGLVGTERVSQG